ncbi:universal stress protein [Aquiflexum lacus]|uniref:universal stress protein n=1 Tax=Aquiflexum lacus TaxID=2483805 RepID=UPI001893DC18|nr:universal stress protein [Aquiflexum lacus]
MKRIIVPIDFSSYSNNAFLSALKIAQKSNSSITLINVVSTELDWKNLSREKKNQNQTILDMEAEAKDKLRAFIMDHKLNTVPVEAVVEVGVPHQEIVNVANEHAANLIVIGAYGMGYTQEKFVGSNLQKVLRNADCPVLAVKKAMNGNDLRKMVFASKFNEDSRPAFMKMKPILKDFQTSVHFLYVSTPSDFINSGEAEMKMNVYAKGLEDLIIHKHVYSHNEPENGIVEFAKKNKIGFIGIASNNRKAKSTYQIGTTDTVLFKSDIPVLSVKMD